MLLRLAEYYEKYDYIVAIIGSVLIWAVGFFTKRFSDYVKSRRLKKFFCFNKDAIDIIISNRHGKLTLSSDDGATELIDTFVTKGEMDAAITVQTMMQKNLGLTANVLIKPTEDKTNNIFCIGGPLSNATTAFYIRTYFSHLTFGVHKDSQYLSERNRKKLADLVHEDDGYTQCGNQIGTIRLMGKKIFDFDREREGYIFLAKLSERIDLQNDDDGAIYICFGNNSITTLGAVKSFQKNIVSLSKILKNKKRYCIIFKCDKKGNLYLDNYNELTDTALLKKQINSYSK